jgi:hypothetical protein
MADGTISQEDEAINIMASIVRAIIGKLGDDAILYYCIPAEALDRFIDVQFHDKIMRMIIEGYKQTAIKAFSINEARAIAVSTQKDPAIAISFGAGMVNVCYTLFGMSIFQFSIVGSGDWIDTETARRFGYDPTHPERASSESPTTIAHRKHKIDLTKPVASMDRIDQAIALHYQILIENVAGAIVNGFSSNIDRARVDQPIPIILAGGTALPPGFGKYFEEVLAKHTLPFQIESVSVHPRPLFAVAEGCLVASETHGD